MKENLLKLALDSIDLSKLACGILDEVLEPALKQVVEKSDNKIDDAVMAMLYPILKKELKKIIEEKIALLKA